MTTTLLTTALTPEQRSALETRGHLRLSPALPERFAVAVLQTLRAAPHIATQYPDPEHGHQLWRYGWDPDHSGDCIDHPLCELGRGLAHDVPRLIGIALTTLALTSDLYRKGLFIDPWDASLETMPQTPLPRTASFFVQLHLVTQTWPRSWGGHLERLGTGESFAPEWNTLDLFDLRQSGFQRPLLLEHVGQTTGFTLTALLCP